MKNKNLILLLAAGAAYWYFFMYKKKQAMPVSQPGTPDVPGQAAPAQVQTQPTVTTEAVTIIDQLKSFSEQPMRTLEHKQDEVYQTYYVNQVNGVKKMGVPFTI
jgi:hypothetical protein